MLSGRVAIYVGAVLRHFAVPPVSDHSSVRQGQLQLLADLHPGTQLDCIELFLSVFCVHVRCRMRDRISKTLDSS